ncbi:unnamed protein product [Eruca vesicaria subsp. sativa]|uniref:Uncharacterized protein n=1 Tax=Eruca vesicaria subsp. sativa TaxID=29727 RepID=A0ABC8L046_ERUVS|nr:unnamed protein product [Eruca vesicaria subsp. sativa]
MTNAPDKVKWVNDIRGRVCWVILASLCMCGFTQLMKIFKDENQLIYKYIGMSLVVLYMLLLIKSIFSETPTIVYESGSCLRSFVPLVFFLIIFFTIYYNQTLEASILILSFLFGIVALVQLLFPIDEFYVGYVVVIIALGACLAFGAIDCDHDEVMSMRFIFWDIFMSELIIGLINYPGNHRFFNRY